MHVPYRQEEHGSYPPYEGEKRGGPCGSSIFFDSHVKIYWPGDFSRTAGPNRNRRRSTAGRFPPPLFIFDFLVHHWSGLPLWRDRRATEPPVQETGQPNDEVVQGRLRRAIACNQSSLFQEMSVRSIVYVSPLTTPEDVIRAVAVEESDSEISISIPVATANNIAKQIQVKLEGIPLDTLKELEGFQLTWKRACNETAHVQDTFINDSWVDSMLPGLSVHTAPRFTYPSEQEECHERALRSRDDILDILGLPNTDRDLVVNRSWWLWNDPKCQPDSGKTTLGKLMSTFSKAPIDIGLLENFDALELIVDHENEAVNFYFYYTGTHAASAKLLKHNADFKQEVAVVTEMENMLSKRKVYNETRSMADNIDADRFVQGFTGKLNSNSAFEMQPAMFVFTPYISQAGSSFDYSIDKTASPAFHPMIEYRIESFDRYFYRPSDSGIADLDACTLNLQLLVNNELILDKYEIERFISSSANNDYCLQSIEMMSNDGMDLELPSYKIKEWGAIAELTIDEKCLVDNDGVFKLPIHLRYIAPAETELYKVLDDPWSSLYWSCPVTEETANSLQGSFFTDHARFTHIDTNPSSRSRRYYFHNKHTFSDPHNMTVPTGPLSHATQIDLTTSLLVVIGTLFIIRSLYR